jgi:hypothetical protein
MSSTSPADHPASPTATTGQRDDQITLEAFPSLSVTPSPVNSHHPYSLDNEGTHRSREPSNSSSLQGRLRSASKNFQESNPPTGMWIATGQIASSVPSLFDVRRGSYSSEGWSAEGQVIERDRRASLSRQRSSQAGVDPTRTRGSTNSTKGLHRHQSVPETVAESDLQGVNSLPSGSPTSGIPTPAVPTPGISKAETDGAMDRFYPKNKDLKTSGERSSSETKTNRENNAPKHDPRFRTHFNNGYQFPPKHTWGESTKIFLVAFWNFFTTPIGFLVTVSKLSEASLSYLGRSHSPSNRPFTDL